MSMPPPPVAPPPPPGYQYGEGGPARNDGKAVAALVCGLVGLVLAGIILGIIAIVFGVQSRKAIDASRGQLKGRGMATAGLVLGIVDIVTNALILIALVSR
jgi:hypothetical protein